jgi:hypothetical protein
MTLSSPPGSAGAIASGSATHDQVNKFKRVCAKRSAASEQAATNTESTEAAAFRDGRSYVSLIKETLADLDATQAKVDTPSVVPTAATPNNNDHTASVNEPEVAQPTLGKEAADDFDTWLDTCMFGNDSEAACVEAQDIIESGFTHSVAMDEAMKGAHHLRRSDRCFDVLIKQPDRLKAACTFCNRDHSHCDGSAKSLRKLLDNAHEHIACASHELMNNDQMNHEAMNHDKMNMKRLLVWTARRRKHNNDADLSVTAANMGSPPDTAAVADTVDHDDNNDPTDVHADADARRENAEHHAQGQNELVREQNQRLAALEAELLELRTRAAQGNTSIGEAAGTSYAAQANVALANMNLIAPMTQHDNAAGATDTVRVAEEGELPTDNQSPLPTSSTPATNMTPMREALEDAHEERTANLLARFGESLAKSLTGHVQQAVHSQMVRPSPGVRPSEIGLSQFSGASSKMATVIEPEFYPRLLLWLEESEHLLRNSGLSTVQQIRTLFANLTGAARKQFTTRWRNLDFSAMTMLDAKEKVFALVPNHQTHFSRAAMDMTFTPANLASDLDRFALYASHGDLPVNGHHFWYRLIQEKLLEACPDLFRLAAEHFGKRVEFKPDMNFNTMIEQFMDVVLAVQTELKAQLLCHKRGYDGTPTNDKSKKPKLPPKDKSVDKSTDLKDDFSLARQVGMCFGCGTVYPVGRNGKRFDKNAHDSVCKKKFARGVVTEEFTSAIAKWRNYVSEGKSLDEIKRIADASRKNK